MLRWSRGAWVALLMSAVVDTPLRGDTAEVSPNRLEDLVKQLGHHRYALRESASRALESQGEKALPALRNARAKSDDLDFRRRAHRVARAIMLGVRKSHSLGMQLVLIDEGEFVMGSPTNESNRRTDESLHRVHITRPFLLGAYEVTQEEYQQVMNTNPSWFATDGHGKAKVAGMDTKRFPVEQVTWFDAIEFCNRLSQRDGYQPYYKLTDIKREDGAIKRATVTVLGGNGYRLPTEAEWEYACRAHTDTPFHFGHGNTGLQANLKAIQSTVYGATRTLPSLGRTARVGSYAPNSWGLYDMHGNVGEWCWDWYHRDYHLNAPVIDPRGPDTGIQRVMRSGSWLVTEGSCRAASRFWHTPDEQKYYSGFRVARSP